MKVLVVLVLLINTLFECMPISDRKEEFSESKTNFSRLSLLNDVELFSAVQNKNQQQNVLPVVSTLIDAIFAVIYFFHSFYKTFKIF